MKLQLFLIMACLLVAASSCKKRPFDYRNKFTGAYLMDVRFSLFNISIPGSNWDSVYLYVGEIRYGETGDEILVYYGDDRFVQLKVDKSGAFTNIPSNYGGGSIINNDSISLVMRWGGLGGGTSHAIHGRRIGS